MRATKQQADLTQQIFAASHRPYLLVTANTTVTDGDIRFDFHLDNKGAVPAVLTEWQATIRLDGRDIIQHTVGGADVTFAVVPGASERMGPVQMAHAQAEPIWGTGKPLQVDAVVKYRGVGSNVYVTRTTYELTMTPHAMRWDRRELRLDD